MKYRKINQQQLRRRLLEGMCRCAQMIHLHAVLNQIVGVIDGETPETFKPGVADKFLFNKIIDERFEEIEELAHGQNKQYINDLGERLYLESYCPRYGDFRVITKKDKREAKERYLEI